MAKRRGDGEGTIQQLPNGRWKAIHTVSWKPRKTRTKTFEKKSLAASWLAQQSVERTAGTESGPASADLLLAEWVTTWLSDIERDREANTHSLYRMILESHVVPALGSAYLRDLKPMAFRNLFADLEREYSGTRTLESVYEVASRCLAGAVKMELIDRNPLAQVNRPKYSRRDILPFETDDVWLILARARPHRLYALFVVAFALGLRQGELFALEWRDVDFDLRTLRIERQAANHGGKITVKPPKTKAGRRTIELANEVLWAFRDRQRVAMKEGLAACPLIFPAPRGGYLQRSSFAVRHWKPILKACGLKARGLHHARHSFATLALTQGCPIHVVSKILGHSSPTITLETYAHLIDTAQRSTVEKVAKLFAG
jgi:integrase